MTKSWPLDSTGTAFVASAQNFVLKMATGAISSDVSEVVVLFFTPVKNQSTLSSARENKWIVSTESTAAHPKWLE